MSTCWEEYLQSWKERVQRRESYEREYSVVTLQWRFLQTTRIVIIAGFIGTLLPLGAGYRSQLIHVAGGSGVTRLDNIQLLALPIVGMLLAIIAGLVEEFITALLQRTEDRALTLEANMSIPFGIMSNLSLRITIRGLNVSIFDQIRTSFEVIAGLWAFGILLGGLTAFRIIS